MDRETDTVQNGSNESPLTNLPDELIENEYLDNDKMRQLPKINYPLHDPQTESRKQKQIVANYGNGDESNSYFVTETSFSEDGDAKHIARASSRQSDGSLGFQSLQPPRHHRTRNATSRDVRNVRTSSDNDGAFNNKNIGSNTKLTGVMEFDASDDNNPQKQVNTYSVDRFDDHAETADSRQRERQRLVNVASMSTRNSSLRNWEPASPSREIHSTIRIMEYSQRQRIRQRSQQLFHSHSPSQGSPLMRTENWQMNADRGHNLPAESGASQLDQTQFLLPNGAPLEQTQFLIPNGAPFSDHIKQSSAFHGSTRREKRSLSFDTSMSTTISEHEAGDIVDYSSYPNRTLDEDEQHSDEARSGNFIQGKQKYKLGHSRSHSTSDTLALGRRRTKVGASVACHSKETKVKSQKHRNNIHQPIVTSRLHKTSSFDSNNGTKSTTRKKSSGNIIDETSKMRTGWNSQMNLYGKQVRHNRSSSAQSNESQPDRKSRAAYVQIDIDHVSDDSGSISDDGEDKEESSFKRRTRVSNRIRSPSFMRKGTNFSPLANIGKSSSEKAARSTFLPTSYGSDDKMYSTFICPRCKTRQREFFTVENAAAGRLEGPGSYLALYFAVYVTCSLFIFGLEEGWKPLDCIYFAVITLTTAGLVSKALVTLILHIDF